MAKFSDPRFPRFNFKGFRLTGRQKLILIIAAIFLAIIVWRILQYRATERYAFHPASEVSRIEYAATRARSWRVSTIGTMRGVPFRTDQDVVCPDQSQTTTYAGPKGQETLAEEIIITKDKMYAHEGNEPWTSEPNTTTGLCAKGPMAGPNSLVETLQNWNRIADFRRVPDTQPSKSSCQVWGFYYGGSPAPMATLCLDQDLKLPLEIQSGPLRLEYSRWNEIGGIAVPDIPLPPPTTTPTTK